MKGNFSGSLHPLDELLCIQGFDESYKKVSPLREVTLLKNVRTIFY